MADEQKPPRPGLSRDEFEAKKTALRAVELSLDPVQGRFDAAHLKEINRRLFQDLPGAGFTDVTPGVFRPSVPDGKDWIKNRALATTSATSFVAYSRMDSAALARLDALLSQLNPKVLGQLPQPEFTAAVGQLYTQLDYIHPFRDGNSRTLRIFTQQLAKEAGYSIEWDRFNRDAVGRDMLYIARDISVNRIALPHMQDENFRRVVTTTLDQFERMRDLPDLLRDAILPMQRLEHGHARQTNRDIAADSLAAAQAYAAKERIQLERVNVEHGRYTGTILHETKQHVVQETGRGLAVIHAKAAIAAEARSQLQVGHTARLQYDRGRLNVLPAKELGHNRGIGH